jgi:hypothetical protein
MLDCEILFVFVCLFRYIDGLISKASPIHVPLRLLCLQSVCGGGIKQKRLDQVKRDIVLQYGFHLLRPLEALARVGLLRAYDRSNFALTAAVRKVVFFVMLFCVVDLVKYRARGVVLPSRRKN